MTFSGIRVCSRTVGVEVRKLIIGKGLNSAGGTRLALPKGLRLQDLNFSVRPKGFIPPSDRSDWKRCQDINAFSEQMNSAELYNVSLRAPATLEEMVFAIRLSESAAEDFYEAIDGGTLIAVPLTKPAISTTMGDISHKVSVVYERFNHEITIHPVKSTFASARFVKTRS